MNGLNGNLARRRVVLESALELEVVSDSIVLEPVMRLVSVMMVLVPFGLNGQTIPTVR